MIKLIDGYGQLGEALKRSIPEVTEDIAIYHKWNIEDKSEEAQKVCFDEFCEFRKNYPGRVVLISTKSDNESPYTRWKKAAEMICFKCDNIVRLPILIGKGPCIDLYNGQEPYGEMELMNIETAAFWVYDTVLYPYDRVKDLYGYKIPARIVKELIQFGKNGI